MSTGFSKDIISIINNIRTDKKTMSKNEILDKYAAFREQCITLFDLIAEGPETGGNTDIMLGNLLGVLAKKEIGKIDDFDASIEVSGIIADKYIYTKETGIKKPSLQELKELKEKLRLKHDEIRKTETETGISAGSITEDMPKDFKENEFIKYNI